MSRHRQSLANEKMLLLQDIAQQRLDLHSEILQGERLCAGVDRGLTLLWRLRRPLSLIGGVLGIYAARHPSRLLGGVKRALSLWGTLRLARKTLYP